MPTFMTVAGKVPGIQVEYVNKYAGINCPVQLDCNYLLFFLGFFFAYA